MVDRLTGLREFWQRLRMPPDALILEVGAGGELVVARLRALLSLAMLALPLVTILTRDYQPFELIAGMAGVTLTAIVAQVWLALAKQARHLRWLPWATASYDITLTTLVLAYLSSHLPVAGLRSLVVWVFYLIAIALTALRNDARLTLFTGFLAVLQFGLLALVVFQRNPEPELLMSVNYGTASISDLIQRLLLLVLMTSVTLAIVVRMQRLVEMSGTDGLTGLPNRTMLVHRFPALLDAARGNGGSLSLCLIDLDYFKRINDEVGHLAGDRALRHAVDTLQEGLDEGDWLTRLGGEELALVMNAPTGRAWEHLETLRRMVASSPFLPEPSSDPLRLTFSAGIASWPQDGNDLSQLLRRADLRLRRAKLEGRNRISARDT